MPTLQEFYTNYCRITRTPDTQVSKDLFFAGAQTIILAIHSEIAAAELRDYIEAITLELDAYKVFRQVEGSSIIFH